MHECDHIGNCTSDESSIEVLFGDIRIGPRFRRDLGDLGPLAADTSDKGLLHPIGVTPDRNLVCGQRRLIACRDLLGWSSVSACVVDFPSIALGEFAENTVRNEFSRPGELVVDPCGGGFTSAVACRDLGRRCVACDVDRSCVVRGQERLVRGKE